MPFNNDLLSNAYSINYTNNLVSSSANKFSDIKTMKEKAKPQMCAAQNLISSDSKVHEQHLKSYEAVSMSWIGTKMFALLVSTMHPFITISSSMKCALSRWNMTSSSHCEQGKSKDYFRSSMEQERWSNLRYQGFLQTYHISKIAVHSFD